MIIPIFIFIYIYVYIYIFPSYTIYIDNPSMSMIIPSQPLETIPVEILSKCSKALAQAELADDRRMAAEVLETTAAAVLCWIYIIYIMYTSCVHIYIYVCMYTYTYRCEVVFIYVQ